MKIGKLDKPPYAHNWVRYVHPDEDKTTKELVKFARSLPRYTYTAAVPIIRDRIMYSLDARTALVAALTKGRANSRQLVAEYVKAFYSYDLERQYSGKPYFDEIVEPFRVSKGIVVPVKPLITIVENGRLVPIFSVGWASFPLDRWQMRLLATIFEDAVFSLTDFRKSGGEFLCFPKADGARSPLVWNRGDFELFSKAEMRDILDLYLSALSKAKSIVGEEAAPDSMGDQQPAATPLLDWGNQRDF